MAGMTSYAKQARQFSAGGVCKVCALALAAVASLGVQAGTKLWYRFDDKPDGYRTTGSDTFPNAVDPTTYPGLPYTVRGSSSTWETTTTSAMPTYGWGFPDGYCVRDPLTGTIHSNTGSVYLVNSTTNVYGRSGAVIVPDNPALYGDAFTIEFFMRGFVYPDNPWQTFMSRIDSDGRYTLVLRELRTGLNGTCVFVTNGVRTAATLVNDTNLASQHVLFNQKWHHVAISVDQLAFVVKIYVDYELMKVTTLPGPLYFDDGGHIVLGAGTEEYGFAQGEFDELRVSEGALTPNQFLHLQFTDDPRVHYLHSFMPYDDIFSPIKAMPTPAPYVTTKTPASFANISEWTDNAWRTNEYVGLVQSSEAGANAALAIPLNDPHILTNGDFTIEFFVRIPPNGTKATSYLINLNDGVRARFNSSSTSLSVMQGWSGVKSIFMADDYWHHIAWVVERSNARVRIFFDYVLQYTISSYTMPNMSSTAKVYIGSYDNSSYKFNTLWLDEVRVTKAALDADTFLRPKLITPLETCRVPFTRSCGDFIAYGYGFNGKAVDRPTPWGTLTLDETNRPSAFIYEGSLDKFGHTNKTSLAFKGNSDGWSGFYKVPDDKANPMVGGSFTAEMFIYLATIGGRGLDVCSQCFMGQSNAFRLDFWQSPARILAIDSSGASFADTVLALGRWYHIAYVQDVEHDELRLYVDRKLVGTKRGIPARNGDPGDYIYLMNSPIRDYYGCFSSAWADEARFTRRALDPEEFLRPYPNGGLYIIFR